MESPNPVPLNSSEIQTPELIFTAGQSLKKKKNQEKEKKVTGDLIQLVYA